MACGAGGGKPAGSWEGEAVRLADSVQKLWAEGGHALSLQYAGTASLKSALLKGGPEAEAAEPRPQAHSRLTEAQSRLTAAAGLASSLASRVTDGASSLQRYYVSHFKDDMRQQAVDALLAPLPGAVAFARAPLLGGCAPSDSAPAPSLLRLLVASWNVNGKGPKEDAASAVLEWLRSAFPELGPGEQPEPPDVVVFGMQVREACRALPIFPPFSCSPRLSLRTQPHSPATLSARRSARSRQLPFRSSTRHTPCALLHRSSPPVLRAGADRPRRQARAHRRRGRADRPVAAGHVRRARAPLFAARRRVRVR